MRSSARRSMLVIAMIASYGTSARADGETAPPAAPSTTPGDNADAPRTLSCDEIPACRLARFKNDLERRRRRDYLLRLAAASQALDNRIEKSTPWRRRFPFEANLLFITNLAVPGGSIGYAPTYWFKAEAWVGYLWGSRYRYDGTSSNQTSIGGTSGGLQARFMPVKFALSPYIAVGWGVGSGHIDVNTYADSGSGQNVRGDLQSHFVTLGAGLELTVPYFHFAAGYQFYQAFYNQVLVGNMPDAASQQALAAHMDGNRHGASIEVGCAF